MTTFTSAMPGVAEGRKFVARPHYAAHMASVDITGLDVALVASHVDVQNAQRAGHQRIVLMQHGIGQSYSDRKSAYPGGEDNDAVGLFLVPGEQPAQRWRDAYPKARVEVVGSPRLDGLPRRVPGPLTVACTFHWRMGTVPEARHAFNHYRDAVKALSRTYNVIGHGHPRATRLPAFYAKAGIEWVASFEDVCRRADVLLFDNTSAGFEFASTGRPVVVMNSPDYRLDAQHGLRFWDAADVGVQVWHPADLPIAVERALTLWPDDVERRERALSIVYGYRSGAAQRSVEVIREWAA